MRKNILALIVLGFCSSCVSDEYAYDSERNSRQTAYTDRNFRLVEARSAHIKPSESMQVGMPKKASYNLKNYYDDVYYDEETISSNNPEIPSAESYRGHFKVGNPYKIFGVSYFPQNYDNFEEVGIASWYGDDFHGKLTANGEIYNMDEMTAAHPTLPLPSMVRVTNLQNGRSAIVRVNDRGPYAKSRILDVSEKAAIALGFRDRGTTEVKVELLRNDTDEMLEKLRIKN